MIYVVTNNYRNKKSAENGRVGNDGQYSRFNDLAKDSLVREKGELI